MLCKPTSFLEGRLLLINITSITQMPDPWDTANEDIVQCNGITYQNIRNEFWLPVGFGAPVYTTGTLPPTTGLLEGAAIAVSNYGGNIAKLVNGQWRYELPFRTTWADRPPVSAVPAGTELQVTDFNNQKWISDGVYWRPAQGRVSLKYVHGLIGSPLATIQNATGGVFAIPGGSARIPAGMIIPHSALLIHSSGCKVGSAGTAVSQATLGVLNSLSDSSAQAFNVSSASLTSILTGSRVAFGTSKTSAFLNTWLGYGSAGGSASNVQSNMSSGINTDADMFVNLGINSANTADSFELFSFEVWLEV